jgi:hypothetical protein
MEIPQEYKLTNVEIRAAFDGDFGEVHFDHKPTPNEILMIKLGLIADKAVAKAMPLIEKRFVDELKRADKNYLELKNEFDERVQLVEKRAKKEGYKLGVKHQYEAQKLDEAEIEKRAREEIIAAVEDFLDMTDGELGFVEIGNHTPFSEWVKFKARYGV